MSLEYQHAIRAVARAEAAAELAIDGMDRAKEWLDGHGAFAGEPRLAALIGQCAHESAGFGSLVESLNYSVAALRATFSYFRDRPDEAARFGRTEAQRADQEAIASRAYGDRMGNDGPESGDGWRYRGRGWIQLTGRANYRATGAALGIPLEEDPGLATDAKVAWQIAVHYLATRRREGRTAFEWADRGDVEQVTRIINGGTRGLDERRELTETALAALREVA